MEPLRIIVSPSPETNDHEVGLFAGDASLVGIFGDRSIGLDPDDILVTPCPLIAASGARDAVVGRCDCGVIGCGDVVVNIIRAGELVTWSPKWKDSPTVRFQEAQYHSEIQRALADHTWETPDRTAARLIRDHVDHQLLAAAGLRFTWASGRARPGAMTVALVLEPGPYQILVTVPWIGADEPAVIARDVVDVLRQPASAWADVQWLPQKPGLGPPEIAGTTWRRGGSGGT